MEKSPKIPRKIHYCWFGGNPLPELAQKCIASWKKFCPDWEIIEWNEKNFDLNYNDYVREAYKAKKWAFVTDVVRLYALVTCGGFYMDTDVEVIRPLDGLCDYDAVSGFESETQIPTGLMACRDSHPLFREFLDDYKDAHFVKSDGSPDLTTNVTRITNICLRHGLRQDNTLQTVAGCVFLPKDYLCPKDLYTRQSHITENTYCIHHFDGSWETEFVRDTNFLREATYKKYKNIKVARLIYIISYFFRKAKNDGFFLTAGYCIKKLFIPKNR